MENIENTNNYYIDLITSYILSFNSLLLYIIISGCIIFYLFDKIRYKQQNYGGFAALGYEKISEKFKYNIENGIEPGGAFALYHHGKCVVDVWGGWADKSALRFRQHDSTNIGYSTTKFLSAICIAILVDRGHLNYEDKISKYWPEFAQNGKEDITIETYLSHRAGLFTLTEKYMLAWLRDDPEALSRVLAKQAPLMKPGTKQAYHLMTYSLYIDQLIQRVDPKKRNLPTFFKEEIAIPFDIDFSIGEKKENFHRACREVIYIYGIKQFFQIYLPTMGRLTWLNFKTAIRNRKSYFYMLLIGKAIDVEIEKLNDPDSREIPCGSTMGIGTATALGKLMGILANGGSHEGKVLLSEKTIEKMSTPVKRMFDELMLIEGDVAMGALIRFVKCGNEEIKMFGHPGLGGQMAFCDPVNKLGWAYMTSHQNSLHGVIFDHRSESIEKVMYETIEKLKKKFK